MAVGCFMAIQGPTNTALSRLVGSAQATLVSFVGSVLVLAVAVAFFGQGDLSRVTEVPAWQLIGGLYGSFIVFTVIAAVPVLGTALTLMALMLGQLVAGVVIDSLGLFLTVPHEVSLLRMLGIGAVAVGIVLIYISRRQLAGGSPVGGFASSMGKSILLGTVSFLAGAGGSVQAATNAALMATVGALEASLVNAIGGTCVAVVMVLVLTRGHWKSLRGAKAWQLLGGFYGALNVLLTAVVTPILGVALMAACVMLGQLGMGALVDSRGWLQTKVVKMDSWRIAGMAFIAIGIVATTAARIF